MKHLFNIVVNGTGETHGKNYKSLNSAQVACTKLYREMQAEEDPARFTLGINEMKLEYVKTHEIYSLSKRDRYRLKVLENKIHRDAVKEQKEIGKWERANTRFEARQAKLAVKAVKAAEAEYKSAVRENKQVAKWAKSNEIYHDRATKRTIKEIAEITKWRKYDIEYHKNLETVK